MQLNKDIIKIRQGNTKDFPAFYPVFKESIFTQFTDDYSALTLDYIINKSVPEDILLQNLKNGNNILFLAYCGEQVVGYILAKKVYGGVSQAQWIAVLPDFQNKHIASKLLALWAKIAKEMGAHALQLISGDRNVAFYKKRGFIYSGRFPNAWFGFTTNYFYKELQEPKEKNYLNLK